MNGARGSSSKACLGHIVYGSETEYFRCFFKYRMSEIIQAVIWVEKIHDNSDSGASCNYNLDFLYATFVYCWGRYYLYDHHLYA